MSKKLPSGDKEIPTSNNLAYGQTETVGEGISMDNNPAYEESNSKEQQENEYELYGLPGPSSQEPDQIMTETRIINVCT